MAQRIALGPDTTFRDWRVWRWLFALFVVFCCSVSVVFARNLIRYGLDDLRLLSNTLELVPSVIDSVSITLGRFFWICLSIGALLSQRLFEVSLFLFFIFFLLYRYSEPLYYLNSGEMLFFVLFFCIFGVISTSLIHLRRWAMGLHRTTRVGTEEVFR